MSKFLLALNIFAVSAFLAMVVGVSQAQAGTSPSEPPDRADCNNLCDITPATECPVMTAGKCACPDDGSICNGTGGDDIICGTFHGQDILAGKGDDIVCAGDGADKVHGGRGCDDLQGEDGDDILHGCHCADRLTGHAVVATPTTDDCYGNWGDDVFHNCGGIEKFGKTDDHKTKGECVSEGCRND